MKQQLIILQGPPGAGKSTYAKYLHARNVENTIIVSRDKIRESLGTYWVESREPIVRNIEQSMVTIGLENGYTVIVDNTGMDWYVNKTWKFITEMYDIPIVWYPIVPSKDVCKLRNKCKDRKQVPDEFIDKWFETYVDSKDNSLKDWNDFKDVNI